MKKLIKSTIAAGLCATAGLTLASCGNKNWADMNFTLNYAVVEENGQNVLHKVKRWTDSESDSVCVETECCGNYVWTSVINASLYKNMPDRHTYDIECPHLHDHD